MVADDKLKFDENGGKFSGWAENIVGLEGKNCSLRAIFPFSTVFSKDMYCRHVKTRACLEMVKQGVAFSSLPMLQENIFRTWAVCIPSLHCLRTFMFVKLGSSGISHWTIYCLINRLHALYGFKSSKYDDFWEGCVTGDHSFLNA